MIDFHTHLLPGLDDGAGFPEDALAMARIALQEGTAAVLLTPHYEAGRYTPSRKTVLKSVLDLKGRLFKSGVDLLVYPGAEVHVCRGMLELVREERVLTVNDGRKYLLVELPFLRIPDFAWEELSRLLNAGITPILAHPERCLPLSGDFEQLFNLLGQGILFQLNAGSLTGDYGQDVQKTAQRMIRQRWIHFLGSDAHSQYMRPPGLGKAAALISAWAGKDLADQVTLNYPQAALKGLAIAGHEVLPPGC